MCGKKTYVDVYSHISQIIAGQGLNERSVYIPTSALWRKIKMFLAQNDCEALVLRTRKFDAYIEDEDDLNKLLFKDPKIYEDVADTLGVPTMYNTIDDAYDVTIESENALLVGVVFDENNLIESVHNVLETLSLNDFVFADGGAFKRCSVMRPPMIEECKDLAAETANKPLEEIYDRYGLSSEYNFCALYSTVATNIKYAKSELSEQEARRYISLDDTTVALCFEAYDPEDSEGYDNVEIHVTLKYITYMAGKLYTIIKI